MKKIKKHRHRLPAEVVEILRRKGGPQGLPKGKKGYRRSIEKDWRKHI